MLIKDLFTRDIFRSINGVVKADQLDDSSVWQELDEFVMTKELDQYFRKFFSSYTDAVKNPNDSNVAGKIGEWIDKRPVYIPTRELLTIYPGFVSFYDSHYLEFEETWRDTCALLAAPPLKGAREASVRKLLEPLEAAIEGRVELDKLGRFYLNTKDGHMEMPLVAEGWRKLAMIAQLIATGSLLDKGYLF